VKAVFGLLGLLVVLGGVYGAAFFGVIPVKKMADKTPALRGPLAALHLVPLKKPVAAASAKAAASPTPAQAALDAGKKQLQADRAQLDKDRAAFAAQKAAPPALASPGDPTAAPTPAAPDTAAKLASIYAAMPPDNLAKLLGGQTDPDAITALTGLDDKKAAKVMTALPPLRASRLARMMAHVSLTRATSSAAPVLRTSL